uniref:Uncharacterized protein n=1 Tax=Arundo donax TaxID=35708 RepID=A0A0A9HQN2_ARUDO
MMLMNSNCTCTEMDTFLHKDMPQQLCKRQNSSLLHKLKKETRELQYGIVTRTISHSRFILR